MIYGSHHEPLVKRKYQAEAIDSLNSHLCQKTNNPCVVLPTGSGKSAVMAWWMSEWKAKFPEFRCINLAHRKELVIQNATELLEMWPTANIGINSAGLGRRDMNNDIIFASIDSVYSKWGHFPKFHAIIIDEAHRIPPAGEGKYRTFIKGCQSINPKIRTIGFTATPYRLGCGNICHADHILNEICYEANVGDLIDQGYLCRLRSKIGDIQPDLSDVTRNGKGDYTLKSLIKAVDHDKIISEAVNHTVRTIKEYKRQSVVFFCVDVSHAEKVSLELRKYNILAPVVHAGTPAKQRDKIANDFKAGKLHAIVNVNVYTEGFNAKCIDCVVLYRPTLSIALYLQMVGRGLRLFQGKDFCLILDYAHCIEEHGPIDIPIGSEVAVIECGECGDVFSRAVRICPNCGWNIPKQVIEQIEKTEREKKMHETKASQLSILSAEPETVKVSSVSVYRHVKAGGIDSVRVEYRCGLKVYREWICLDHGGWAEIKARQWWQARFGPTEAREVTVASATGDLFLPQKLLDWTESVIIKYDPKTKKPKIIGYVPRTKDCK